MAKIDTSKIEGFDAMTPEEKIAALSDFEFDDFSAEVERQKNAVSKANKEAAEWKRKHNALLSEEEKKKQEDEDSLAEMQKELAALRKDKTISEFKSKLIGQGYDEQLATDTATAMVDGDTDKVFANQSKFLEGYAKNVKADALKKTPRPHSGGSTEGVDYTKKIKEAQDNGDIAAVAYYNRLMAQEAAQEENK